MNFCSNERPRYKLKVLIFYCIKKVVKPYIFVQDHTTFNDLKKL